MKHVNLLFRWNYWNLYLLILSFICSWWFLADNYSFFCTKISKKITPAHKLFFVHNIVSRDVIFENISIFSNLHRKNDYKWRLLTKWKIINIQMAIQKNKNILLSLTKRGILYFQTVCSKNTTETVIFSYLNHLVVIIQCFSWDLSEN